MRELLAKMVRSRRTTGVVLATTLTIVSGVVIWGAHSAKSEKNFQTFAGWANVLALAVAAIAVAVVVASNGLPREPGRGWTAQHVSKVLAVLGALAVSFVLIWNAAFSGSDTEFSRTVGWANVFALAVSSLGVVISVVDSAQQNARFSTQRLMDARREVAAVVLERGRLQRARLLGIDRPDTRSIDLGYFRDMVHFRHAGGDDVGTLESIERYYSELKPARLVIQGEAGSGKTVLSTHLAVQLLERALEVPTAPVPVMFNCTAINFDKPLDVWMAEELVNLCSISGEDAKRLVRDRMVLPVLDGLDELDNANTSSGRGAILIERLNSLIDGGELSGCVLTCREERYSILPTTLIDATHVKIKPLEAPQIHAYLMAQLHTQQDRDAWRPVLDALSTWRGAVVFDAIVSGLSTPWRLTLAVTACRDGANPAELMGRALEDWRRGFTASDPRSYLGDLLLSRFVLAATRLRGDSRYSEQNARKWLSEIAAELHELRDEGTETEIDVHRWWIFSSRFNRYFFGIFAAIATTGLMASSGLIEGYLGTPLWRIASKEGDSLYLLALIFLSIVLVGVFTMALWPGRRSRKGKLGSQLPIGLFVASLTTLGAVQVLPQARPELLATIGMCFVTAGFQCAMAANLLARGFGGLLALLLFSESIGLFLSTTFPEFTYGFIAFAFVAFPVTYATPTWHPFPAIIPTALIGILAGFIFCSVSMAIRDHIGSDYLIFTNFINIATPVIVLSAWSGTSISWLTSQSQSNWIPRVTRNSIGKGLFIAAFLLPLLNTWHPLLVSTFAVTLFLSAFIAGHTAVIRHAVSVLGAWSSGKSPLRVYRFLNWAETAGLLRKSGRVYQFRHKELEDYLARALTPTR
ncbi:NACHT domain-containing protein [Lentzea sp. NPDC003310]|uniref:NACHT domain-containing protein n=1 Tax=Lentzea sp. NPDC003310 TaxID=3154447 RepID=UPI0033BDE00A